MCLQVRRREWSSPHTKLVMSMTQRTLGPSPCYQSCPRSLKGWCINSWWQYLEAHKLLTDFQFGFQPGCSTEMALLSWSNWAHPAGHGKETAFSALPSRLEQGFQLRASRPTPTELKLRSQGNLNNGIEQPWFSSYLKGGTQTVKVRTHCRKQDLWIVMCRKGPFWA